MPTPAPESVHPGSTAPASSTTTTGGSLELDWPLLPSLIPSETFPSWVRTLGRTYRLDTKRAAGLIGLPVRRQNYLTMHTAVRRCAPGIALRTGEPQDTLETMGKAWQLPRIYRPTALPRSIGGVDGSSFCPACLSENGGRWLSRWLNPLSTHCLRHGTCLRARCPVCQSRPFRNLAWLWANGPGWKCYGQVNHNEGSGSGLRKICGYDLRQMAPAWSGTAELLEAQAHVEMVLSALAAPAPVTLKICGEEVRAKYVWKLYSQLIILHGGLRLKDRAYQGTSGTADAVLAASRVLRAESRSQALQQLRSGYAGARINLSCPTTNGSTLNLYTARGLRSGVHGGISVKELTDQGFVHPRGSPTLPEINFHERYLPSAIWPSAIKDLDIKQGSLTRMAVSAALVRAIHRTDWSRAANRLGLQYKDHQRLASYWKKADETGALTRLIHELKPDLETHLLREKDLIDYGRRRAEIQDPAAILGMLGTLWSPAGGPPEDIPALARRLWALYTGGDPRFVPARYCHLPWSYNERRRWELYEEHRRSAEQVFHRIATKLLNDNGAGHEPLAWEPFT